MALVECSGCKKRMSSFAARCPNCGARPVKPPVEGMKFRGSPHQIKQREEDPVGHGVTEEDAERLSANRFHEETQDDRRIVIWAKHLGNTVKVVGSAMSDGVMRLVTGHRHSGPKDKN